MADPNPYVEEQVKALLDVADEVCAGRAVIVTEGGYDLDAIEDCLGEVIRVAS